MTRNGIACKNRSSAISQNQIGVSPLIQFGHRVDQCVYHNVNKGLLEKMSVHTNQNSDGILENEFRKSCNALQKKEKS